MGRITLDVVNHIPSVNRIIFASTTPVTNYVPKYQTPYAFFLALFHFEEIWAHFALLRSNTLKNHPLFEATEALVRKVFDNNGSICHNVKR